jgi:hypothetical protein
MNEPKPQPEWWDLGQHEYTVPAQAQQKRMQMHDDGHKCRVVNRRRNGQDVFVVQIFCI